MQVFKGMLLGKQRVALKALINDADIKTRVTRLLNQTDEKSKVFSVKLK